MAKRPTRLSSNGTSANGVHPIPSGTAARAGGEPVEIGEYGRRWGWDAPLDAYTDLDLPTYVGPTTFSNLPWVEDPAELEARGVDVAIVGAPYDDMVTHRPGARFGPRAARENRTIVL